jgi:hypothetical protein
MQVIKAHYLNDYKIEIVFSDNKKNIVDFLPALKKLDTCKKYLDVTKFKKFKIEQGNVVWGKNWEMIFTLDSLYNNNLA